ncbi:pyridoxal-phosphate dependent enzyme [Burkholderia sp. Ac-20353]|uniref:pyridoxal-phosphate dependent enzyme n=1 Tax=Burkholderia sp. Ac-20353 TaxID=2703894 RepID=UPI00197BD76C|nr:pyridoxal-phosphate dependent enzyme [Burkholderia sp. Ac-20353]MBN3786016.1 pyridoxal-phosphate dependent enzyme [Burkholderia sp. Ac-20353]
MTLHIETPLIKSRALSLKTGRTILLKLEGLQPSGSFKLRGVGFACEEHKRRGARRFITASGGNAGCAVAYAGRELGIPVTVVVPQTTSERAKSIIRGEEAEVVVHGANFGESNAYALSMLGDGDAYLPAFDDPLLWEGHATMVEEIARQTERPDLLVCSVGGGGLLAGVIEGLRRVGWSDIPVLTVETEGADSYDQALKAGEPVALPKIQSIATSLGANKVTARIVALAKEHQIRNCLVTDAEAIQGSVTLLEEHRLLTEPACGASVAALARVPEYFPDAQRIVVIACGGVGTTSQQLLEWSDFYRLEGGQVAASHSDEVNSPTSQQP